MFRSISSSDDFDIWRERALRLYNVNIPNPKSILMNKRGFYKQYLLKWIIRKRNQKKRAIFRKSFADHDNMQKAYKVAFQWKAVRNENDGQPHREERKKFLRYSSWSNLRIVLALVFNFLRTILWGWCGLIVLVYQL